jgi:D-serine deaminase-like pyridoxal phosphate-dependent protein
MVSMETLDEAATPALVLDRGRLVANAQRLIARARKMGVGLRPHLKTLKSIDAARIAIDPRHGGIAAATLNEAAYFASHGIGDIQLAVCLPPGKFPRVTQILRQAPRFSFFIDSIEVAVAAAAYARDTGTALRAWIEVDSGGRRTGVPADGAELLAIAGALGTSVHLEGVATHAGQSYADLEPAAIAAVAEDERVAVVAAAQRLRDAGFSVAGVSAGSTPTTMHARSAAGLTEWRAGVYLAGDLFQAAIQSLAITDIAMSVVSTVISHHRGRRQVVVDAGGLALSKDRSTASMAGRDGGYGLLTDLDGHPFDAPLHVSEVHQEHGVVHDVDEASFQRLPIGARVRILPNHACMTAAMYGEYLVIDGAREISARWPRTNGWA